MRSERLAWKLLGFPEAIEAWIERESPNHDTRLVVLGWVMGRHDDPYRGMRREDDLGNLWFGPVRGTESGWQVVTCSYWIYERTRIVRCNIVCTLNQPL